MSCARPAGRLLTRSRIRRIRFHHSIAARLLTSSPVTRFHSIFFFSSRRRHTRCSRDWSSDVCSSDLTTATFDHSTTGFPLTNSHQLAPAGKVTACTDCHINNNYNLTTPPNACGNSGCHLTTWQQTRSEEHTSELQSRLHLVCRLLLEKKKKNTTTRVRGLQSR